MPAVAPVMDPGSSGPVEQIGAALALSGGGYRAMLFHTGAIWRLGELGFFQNRVLDSDADGPMRIGKLERISSVSGGSITSAAFALAFTSLEPHAGPAFAARFVEQVVMPIRRLASTTLAGGSAAGVLQLLKDIVLPGSVNQHVAGAYRKALFGDKTLQDLPDRVRFVINASNLQSGALWRFSKPFMRDWRVGEVRNPKIPLAVAVAASSAFPPFLAPAMLSLKAGDYTPGSGQSLQHPPYTTSPRLADGGVYDNLGLETCFKRYMTLFVSNAGKPFEGEPKVARDWVSLGKRCLDVVDNQVLSLRKRMLLDALVTGQRFGAFWDIQQSVTVHACSNALPCPTARTAALASVPTDLAAKSSELQERLINWGYAVADASVRAWFNRDLPAPTGFPYPDRGV